MSKVVSISMATVLMLMSLVGPMQPTNFAEDAPPEMNPAMENAPLHDATDGEEALVDEQSAPVATLTGEPPVDDPQDDLTPTVEPTENANSPPASEAPVSDVDPVVEDPPVAEEQLVVVDEPVVEEEPVVEDKQPGVEKSQVDDTNGTTEVPDDTVMSPSAVDPNPGDCPVGEICDGGGGGDPVTVDVGFHATSVEGINTVTVGGAMFTISTGSTTVGEFTGNHNGYVVVPLVSGTLYSVVVTANGYDTEAAYSVTPSETNDYFSFMLHKSPPATGTITINVIDGQSRQPIEGAEINLVYDRTWSFADSGMSESDGSWTSQELVEGKYWASVTYGDDEYHGQYDIAVDLPASGPLLVELQPITKSPISLKFVDAITGDSIEGVFFELAKEGHGTDVEDYSSTNGEFTTSPMEHGNYGLNAMKDGYGYVIDFRWDHPAGDTVVIEMQPFADGSLTFKLVDDQTGVPLPNAYITIFRGNFGEEIAVAQTDQNGEWTTPVLPGGFYAAAIYPLNHYAVSFTFTVTSGNHPLTLELTEFNDVGYLNVHVIDVTYGYDVEDAKITVREKDMGTVATGFTDQDGIWNVPYLPAGMYIVTIERIGYATKVIESGKNHGDYHLGVEMYRLGQWKFRFWLRLPTYKYPDRVTYLAQPSLGITNGLMPIALQTDVEYQPVVGANVQLLNPDSLDVVAETISGEDGFVDLGNVTEGDYILQITGDGIEYYSQPVSVTGDMEFHLDLTPSQISNPGDDEVDDADGEDDLGTTPGTEDPGEGTVPDAGDPDEGTTPGTGNPDKGTTPGIEDSGEDTTPGIGDPGVGITPGTGNPDNGASADVGTPDESPAPGIGNQIDGSIPGDNDFAEEGASTDSDAVVQAAASSTDVSTGSVNQLPNTGAGESESHIGMAALTLVATLSLLGALGIRRSTR